MQGLMMNTPLTLTPLLERAGRLFAKKEIASRTEAGMHRYTYADFYLRVHRLAWTLKQMGIQPGDRVGTLCWNSYRHLELYFAVTCYGAVLPTLNLRLPAGPRWEPPNYPPAPRALPRRRAPQFS